MGLEGPVGSKVLSLSSLGTLALCGYLRLSLSVNLLLSLGDKLALPAFIIYVFIFLLSAS